VLKVFWKGLGNSFLQKRFPKSYCFESALVWDKLCEIIMVSPEFPDFMRINLIIVRRKQRRQT
jgi:hypothetical protein